METFVYALGGQVSDRLRADSLLGRSLTLSVMRRAYDAPVEPAKFLGHGRCDSFSYRSPITGQCSAGTSDAEVISASAWRLLQAHHSTDVTDLRGIGICVTNIEHTEAKRYNGQSTLPFEHRSGLSPVHFGPNRHPSTQDEPSVDLIASENDTPVTPTKLTSAGSNPITRRRKLFPHHKPSTNSRIPTLCQQFSTSLSDMDLQEIDKIGRAHV